MHKVWCNHGMGLLADIFNILRSAGDSDIIIVASHQQPDSPIAFLSDEFFIEPNGLEGDEYVDWCFQFALRHGIELFIPSREMVALAAAKERFISAGIRVMVPGTPEALKAINDKGALYSRLNGTAIPIPEWKAVSTLAELLSAYHELRQRHDRVCFKPASGVFGHGFRIFTEKSTPYERLLKSGPYTATSEMSVDEAEFVFGSLASFDELIVMPYLEGPERSVDCVAHKGELVACLIRLKDSHDGQVIETNDAIVSFVEELTEALSLDGMFNVQFRDSGGVHYLLEANPRWSGGLHKACIASGFPLPLWGIKVALGLVAPQDVPAPQTGAKLIRRTAYDVIPAQS